MDIGSIGLLAQFLLDKTVEPINGSDFSQGAGSRNQGSASFTNMYILHLGGEQIDTPHYGWTRSAWVENILLIYAQHLLRSILFLEQIIRTAHVIDNSTYVGKHVNNEIVLVERV